MLLGKRPMYEVKALEWLEKFNSENRKVNSPAEARKLVLTYSYVHPGSYSGLHAYKSKNEIFVACKVSCTSADSMSYKELKELGRECGFTAIIDIGP